MHDNPFHAECVVPILNVKDIQASFRYYTEVLLFRKAWDWGDPPDFGSVQLGHVEIFLCQGGQGSPGTWMSIFVNDIDAYHEAIRGRGADIVMEPRDEPWHMREMHVRDPDGHVIRFGTGTEHDHDHD